MGTVTTMPAPEAGWADVERTMTGGGDGASCWCQWFLLSNADFDATPTAQKKLAFEAEIRSGARRGVVAYLDGDPAGWCRIAPRTVQTRLLRSQILRATPALPLDDASVWALTCLVVRRQHRGKGVTGALIDAAVDLARQEGARLIEAYPRVPAPDKPPRSNDLYVGTPGMFEKAGFRVSAEPRPGRLIMELALA